MTPVRFTPAALAAALLSVLAAPAAPQAGAGGVGDRSPAPDTLVLEGRVLRGADSVPVPGQTVVLHRVAPEGGQPVDSVRTGEEGRFSFDIAPAGGVVHLATARYDGVLYFGPAVHGGELPGSYEIRVWEARPAATSDTVRIRRRTLVVTPAEGAIRVMDVAEVSTGAERTLSAPEGEDRGWWGVRLPGGVREVQVLPGGVDAGAVRIAEGRARVSAAIPPRGARLVLGYLAPGDRSLALEPGPTTGRVEVVARGAAGGLTVEGLRPAGTSSVEGGEVRRWASAGGAGTVRITAASPGGGSGAPTAAWIAAAVGVLAAIGAFWAWRADGSR